MRRLISLVFLAGCSASSALEADCVDKLKRAIDTPSTFKVIETTIALADEYIAVDFDAENLSGANVRSKGICILKKIGDVYLVESADVAPS